MGRVRQWVHAGTRSYFDLPPTLAATADMCNGATIGFSALDPVAVRTIVDPVRSLAQRTELTAQWRECAFVRECIAPEGARATAVAALTMQARHTSIIVKTRPSCRCSSRCTIGRVPTPRAASSPSSTTRPTVGPRRTTPSPSTTTRRARARRSTASTDLVPCRYHCVSYRETQHALNAVVQSGRGCGRGDAGGGRRA